MINFVLDPLSRVREIWPEEKFRELGLPGYAVPKGHGRLPEGERFEDFERVAAAWMEGARVYGYRDFQVPSGSSIVIFTWVMCDGLGDWSAQHVVASILKKAMPNVRIELVTLVEESEKRFLSHSELPAQVLYYKENGPASFTPTILKKLANATLILQTPTFYPHFNALFEQIKQYTYGTLPTCAHIGEYGFIDSEWYHPNTGNSCMGLHPLEKGLLLHTHISEID